eukprot:278690_1
MGNAIVEEDKRCFFYEDRLQIKVQNKSKWKEKWCVLTKDKKLLIFKSKLKIKMENKIDLINANVNKQIENNPLLFSILPKHHTDNINKKKLLEYTLCAENMERKNQFIINIGKCLNLNILLIKKNMIKTLENDDEYIFDFIKLEPNSTLTIKSWDGKKGGKLFITCLSDIIMCQNSNINVTGTGYRGSTHFTADGECAEKSKGGGYGAAFSGGGGGYGTDGRPGFYFKDYIRQDLSFGKGGLKFGYRDLRKLYLGSGGGGGMDNSCGGRGGGILKLQCNSLILKSGAKIECNGSTADYYGGSGSGGSILINVHDIEMDVCESTIEAKGGEGHYCVSTSYHPGDGGDREHVACGGMGRIRINLKLRDDSKAFLFINGYSHCKMNIPYDVMQLILIYLEENIIDISSVFWKWNVHPKPFLGFGVFD